MIIFECSLLHFLQPHNYILSNNWRLSRDRSLNIGWENEDHNTSTIHSITTSYDNQYPNLYPDWTHLYYGSLKLSGYNDENIENLKCISSKDGTQLVSLSINRNKNSIIVDVYEKTELDFVENRMPIIKPNRKDSFKHVNNISPNYNIVFPLDDYNEVWINTLEISSIRESLKNDNYNKLVNKINNNSESYQSNIYNYKESSIPPKPQLEISPNGNSLLLSFYNKIYIQQLQDNNEKEKNNNIVVINEDYIVKDIKFIPDSNKRNSFLVLAYDNSKKSTPSTSLSSIKKNKIILYNYEEGGWVDRELELPYILSNSVRMVTNKEKGDDYDCYQNNKDTYEQPILIAFQDLDFTVHLTQLFKSKDKGKDYIKIIKSLPIPFHSETPLDSKHHVSIGFSKDSSLISIQYPNSNIIYILKKDSDHNGIYDFKLTSIIDELPTRVNGDVLLFNLKYNYLVTNFGGHLSFFRDLADQVSHCDKTSRTKSYYLPSPPIILKNDQHLNQSDSLLLEKYGILYLLKNDQTSLNSIKVKYIIYTIFGYLLIYRLQRRISQFEYLYLGPFIERILKKKSKKLTLANIQEFFFYIIALFILGFSFYEIVNQPAFTNDWPAHIHHIDQFLNPPSKDSSIFKNYIISNQQQYEQLNTNSHYFKSFKDQHQSNKYFEELIPALIRNHFDFDYSHYMHYHGPNTYPAGFTYLYTFLYYISNRGNCLQIFQAIWAILEFINFILIKRICSKLKIPIFLSILPIISNRLHLYNVRIVINDFPSTFLIHIAILLFISKRFKLFSIIYSLTVSLKLHTIFYSPAILFIFFNSLTLNETIYYLSIMAIIQILLGLPFLLVNPVAYISNAYDLSRTLLWEKTRNFKFVGRILYDMKLFNLLLILALVLTIIVFIMKYQNIINQLKKLENIKIVKKLKVNDIKNFKYYDSVSMELIMNRIFTLSFISINFFAIVWARGLYTPFMCWYFYTLPIILYFSEFSNTFIILYWISHEVLYRAFKDLYFEMFATWLFFNINLSIIIRLFQKFKPHDKNNIKLYNINNSTQEIYNKKLN
ncbi:hypothetical protein DICPUDRAFT_153070 [Dictyostelium purpureum]|uniref:Uncharacterized protein n=1 Tax=Dictyostelium purpureum TaxID=5786 RepID=F0ZMZ4_DICPU|nr:uncharacterized protein DICPUDRAFT_153070 [Dictyostelium purpureum]EGC34695.1 hypothetical protein DICPUDRAFT_153070 [Dictyostelium purpureum]|eukprot:XP_003288780.1 hypothetical protein DICPUDRAFT_153070 [Dictyostelium purpureum]